MKAFFDKLTGGAPEEESVGINLEMLDHDEQEAQWVEPDEDEELMVDVYQDQENIYIKSFIPSVSPGTLDIDISRDMVTIRGQKFKDSSIEQEDYFQRELTWGSFSRKILLPREIDIDAASASAKEGLMTLKLPKIDKDRKSKLQVMSQ